MNSQIEKDLFEYFLRIGDTSLILSHRLAEWCGHGPVLEEDIALTNISLDLLGQARIALTQACTIENKNQTEDDLAFKRNWNSFRNIMLAELPNGDFSMTILRQFLISSFQYFQYEGLLQSKNPELAAFAEKSIKEVQYHLRHSEDWVIRLGDGLEESNKKLQDSLNVLWVFTGDLFDFDDIDRRLNEQALVPDLENFHLDWIKKTDDVFLKANVIKPQMKVFLKIGSRKGYHTEHLGHLLSEMQFIPKTFPFSKW